MFVLGTAGHIDHGKSALVRALTGIDPDRLPEEKERSMTIDLGFAWLKLPSGREVSIVDVPGHEHFIKNMLAGVGGIDLALLIIAADEGVEQQTREHLAIIDLLGINKGIVVLTKSDLVDEEWLGLMRIEAEELVQPTSLAGSPIIPVSSVTGAGIPELVSAIDKMLQTLPPKKDINRPRLPIDRIFSISGAGTIVTGTLIDGSLRVGDEIEIIPPGLKSRLRGLQTHKSKVEVASPGSRVAANLVGLALTDIERGEVLARPGWLLPTQLVTAQVRLLKDLPRPIAHNTEVSFHTGSAETPARVRWLDRQELKPGETAFAQLVLDNPVALVKGDRFIIRSPMETLGGGQIVESHAKRHKRFRDAVMQSLEVREEGSAAELIMTLLESKQPLDIKSLATQSELPREQVESVISSLVDEEKIVAIGEGENRLLLTRPGWADLVKKAVEALSEYHKKYPVRVGMSRAELGSRLKLGAQTPLVVQRLVEKGNIVEEGTVVRLPEHSIKLTQAQQAKVNAFLQELERNPYSPASELIPETDLLNMLIDQGKVIKVSGDVIFSKDVYDKMVAKVIEIARAKGKITLAEARDVFQTSRKYVLPLLEHLDRLKITCRVGDERVLVQPQAAKQNTLNT